MSLGADLWGDRRAHAARLVCRLLGHRWGGWSEPIDFKWHGQLLVQQTRACLRCPETEVQTVPVDTLAP